MSDIAKLTVALYANSAQFVSELEKSKKKSKDWSSYVSNSFASAAKASAGAATATVAALGLIYKQQSSLIDQTAKFADRIGISTEALTQYRYASELTGVGQQKFDTAMQRMTRRMSEAAQGTGAAAGAIKELNLTAAELNQLTPDQQLKRVADAMQNVESQSDRLRLSVQLFDTEGAAMVNMLANGSQGLNDMAAEADRLGVTLSRIDAAKIEMANDSLFRVNSLTKALKQNIAIELAPVMAGLADEFLAMSTRYGGMNKMITDGLGIMVTGVGYLADGWRGVELIVKSLEVAVTGFKIGAMISLQAVTDGVISLGEMIVKTVIWPLQESLNIAARFSDTAAEMATSLYQMTSFQAPELFDAASANQAKLDLNQAIWELKTLASQPLPSEGIEAWYQNAKLKFDQLAKGYAASVNQNSGMQLPSIDGEEKEDRAVLAFKKANEEFAQDWQRRIAINAAGEQADTLREEFAYEDRMAKLADHFTDAYAAAKNNHVLQQELEEQYFMGREVLWQDHQDRLSEIEKESAKKRAEHQQRVGMELLGFTQQQMSMTTDMLKNGGQESSKLYKTLFFAQKAAAIPSMIVATNEAYTKALAAFPLTPYYAESVRAMGYASVGIAAGTALAGMSHDGSSGFANGRIPKEGTWLLDQGQRVQTRPEADRTDALHAAVIQLAQKIQGSGSSSASNSGDIHQHFQFSALDARGMDELILNHRSTIYNAVKMVKNDMGEKF
ncbi:MULTISPECIES: hypothetical protein [unclassified Vibrio]|uniref:hypothetical protein n=1 Tax=unclassified Vibrio TaxID=2614977 RepID=UPI0014825452|nr:MULTISPECIES: hypothetical protein [unclassified Vibrio]MDQ2107600.1 hypothetical protein [Vibrio sp. 2017_1457_15]MDQ2160412.1 hypothetical protein [Vibrio sp. 2017_1457_13]NNN44723.1 hypothetical protein [Vibrio sp. 1-1(7)]NNN72096.1 hypothetical protein [Vibrio sp. 12-2(3-a)]